MTQGSIVPFQFENHEIRAIDRDGEPWFVLVDVCKILGHTNPTVAASRLDADEKSALNISDAALNSVAQQRLVNIISESGLYSLILTSRLPDAKRFKKWITSEVLPAIRKTGSYHIDRPKTTGEMLIENAKAFRELEIRQIEHTKQLESHEKKLEVLGAHERYRSIQAHARLTGIKLSDLERQTLGQKASKLSREKGYIVERQYDKSHGTVGSYHLDILEIVFAKEKP